MLPYLKDEGQQNLLIKNKDSTKALAEGKPGHQLLLAIHGIGNHCLPQCQWQLL